GRAHPPDARALRHALTRSSRGPAAAALLPRRAREGHGRRQAEEPRQERHGGIAPAGPHPQTSPQEPATGLVVCSGPVVLSVRPLSDYQHTLIGSIVRLRANGWTDRQIANHFNLIGMLTPRGRSWLPQ